MQPEYWKTATRQLARRDVVIKNLVKVYPDISLRSRGDAFSTLARSIVGQQISVKAADSVWKKLNTAVTTLTPLTISKTDILSLRACGLSGRKVEYLHDLSKHFLEKSLNPHNWNHLEDEALIIDLCRVKGIGRWTAEMFLIFYLLRPNVLPVDDIGLQRAMSLHYNKKKPLTKEKMRKIAQNWEPWCSVATWYMWRSLDPIPVEY
jgi:DNA-3-methyladenine glycosylase II